MGIGKSYANILQPLQETFISLLTGEAVCTGTDLLHRRCFDCRQPVAVSSGGGGGNADSDLRWDGRRPDEEEEAYRRCLLHASGIVMTSKRGYRRR